MIRALSWIALIFLSRLASAQLPVEMFVGNDRTTADVLWFRPFPDSAGNPTRFLFFNRSRAAVDYSNRTSFGTTLAVSYNFPSGLGLVVTGQFFNQGFFPKAGLQYFRRNRDLMVFTWLTAELLQKSKLDWFLLSRWEPALSPRHRLFSQLELLTTADPEGNLALVQRLRLGLGFARLRWQAGLGLDLGQTGRTTFSTTSNIGIFIRKEF